jgi:hypothetical protein
MSQIVAALSEHGDEHLRPGITVDGEAACLVAFWKYLSMKLDHSFKPGSSFQAESVGSLK